MNDDFEATHLKNWSFRRSAAMDRVRACYDDAPQKWARDLARLANRCVRVFPEDSYLQCIHWRDHTQDELQVLSTTQADLIFVSANDASVGRGWAVVFPKGAKILRRDFYVDDQISGGASVDEAIKMQQTSRILAKTQFLLRKWWSNVAAVLSMCRKKIGSRF